MKARICKSNRYNLQGLLFRARASLVLDAQNNIFPKLCIQNADITKRMELRRYFTEGARVSICNIARIYRKILKRWVNKIYQSTKMTTGGSFRAPNLIKKRGRIEFIAQGLKIHFP